MKDDDRRETVQAATVDGKDGDQSDWRVAPEKVFPCGRRSGDKFGQRWEVCTQIVEEGELSDRLEDKQN